MVRLLHLSPGSTAVRTVRALPWLVVALCCATPAGAQRHPESAGPLRYYSDEPGTLAEPHWLQRPPFVRGPLDRYERGKMRMFLGTQDAEPYLNYADDRYILYYRETIAWTQTGGRNPATRFVRWDRMGNYMGSGYQRVFTWEEARGDQDESGYSYIDHQDVTLRIGHYSYQDLHWTVTAGDDIRTLFTPLTLNMGHMEVARMDMDYGGRDKATVLFNRGRSGFFSEWGLNSGDNEESSPVLMYAGHWQHNIGNYATFGTTFLNQFMSQPSSPRSNAWRGDLPYQMLGPRIINVYVLDDSPDEAQYNARVFGLQVVVEGEADGEQVRRSSDPQDEDYDFRLRPEVSGGRLLGGGGREAQGNEPVVYSFTMPVDMTVRSARFFADVADDYRIGVRQTHDFLAVDRRNNAELEEMQWPADFRATDAAKRQPFKYYMGEDEVLYYTVARAEGQSTGEGNRQVVSFDYGMPTGQALASVDWEAKLVGLELSGEVAHNLQNFMFPLGDNEGERTAKHAWAYWMKGVKELPAGIDLGGELYRMDPDYSGDYDSYRGGMAFHLDEQPSTGRPVDSMTQEYWLVEDNDDHDQWPDSWNQETIQSGELYPGWPNAGTYPGLDTNSDNVADVDRNENLIPDWEEPFVMFESDPPEFVYGVDLNNNEMPDFRENDDRPDYPYPRDQEGHHVFLRLNRLGRLGDWLSAGYYAGQQIAGGGESEALYLRYQSTFQDRWLGSVRINYDVKRVEDDIADHSYRYVVPPDDVDMIQWINTPDGPPERAGRWRPATPDTLAMRDSWVHTAFIDERYESATGIKLRNQALYSRNAQAEIELEDGTGLLQPEAVISRYALVNTIDYTWERGGLSVRPRFKHRVLYEADDVSEQEDGGTLARRRRSTSEFIPIVTAEYGLTSNTRFVAGAQGLPLLPYRYWDRVNDDGSYDQTDYLAMVKITSEYQGINTSFFLGYQRTRQEYDRYQSRNKKNGTLFLDIISAF